jgi:hypothetical protein
MYFITSKLPNKIRVENLSKTPKLSTMYKQQAISGVVFRETACRCYVSLCSSGDTSDRKLRRSYLGARIVSQSFEGATDPSISRY